MLVLAAVAKRGRQRHLQHRNGFSVPVERRVAHRAARLVALHAEIPCDARKTGLLRQLHGALAVQPVGPFNGNRRVFGALRLFRSKCEAHARAERRGERRRHQQRAQPFPVLRHNGQNSLFHALLSSVKARGQNGARPALPPDDGDDRFRVILPLVEVCAAKHALVACGLAVERLRARGTPHERIEPVQRAARQRNGLAQHVAALEMRQFMAENQRQLAVV